MHDVIDAYLADATDMFQALTVAPRVMPTAAAGVPSFPAGHYFVPAPEPLAATEHPLQARSRRGRRVDFVALDARNRELGRLGEEFIVGVERRRLLDAGRDDLAAKIEWVSQTQGDGLGFDVLSFDEAEASERPIEVKTTGLGAYFPFYLSRTEVQTSRERADTYHLYRVFDFGRSPRVYKIRGDLNAALHLEPTQFLARVGT